MDEMKHPSVSRIISVALALLTAIVATSTILGLRAQQYSNSSVDKVQREIRVILDIVDAINHTRTARTWLAQGALKLEQGDEASAFTYVAAAREKMKLSEASFQRYTDLKKDASEEKLAREFQDKYYYYKEKGIAPLITSLEMGNLRTYRTVLGSTTQMLDRTFEKSLDIVLNYRESKSKLLNESIKEKFRYDVAVICALAFSYFIGMVVIWRFSITMLSVPLNEMVNALEHVSKNDFTFVFRNPLKRMPYEIVLMRHSLSVMQAKLSQTVISISETAESVRRASSEISQATQDLARRTERQAHQFQTSAVALNNMSEELRNTTSVSGDVASVSTRAAVVANEGMQGVARVVHTMESIQSASERIDVIVSTIDSIAFQTNILALNAAVEAARAGNQGRGFAVVASEVRSLSKRSADAAAEIKRLINDITMRIGSGSIHAIEAGEIVKALVENVQSSAELISGVKVSITKQSEEITDLTAIMTRLDLMTQQNSAMVEQSAAATDSLRILADALADSMADFKPIKNAASVKGSGGLSVRLQFS